MKYFGKRIGFNWHRTGYNDGIFFSGVDRTFECEYQEVTYH
jgi:hypothetical protein